MGQLAIFLYEMILVQKDETRECLFLFLQRLGMLSKSFRNSVVRRIRWLLVSDDNLSGPFVRTRVSISDLLKQFIYAKFSTGSRVLSSKVRMKRTHLDFIILNDATGIMLVLSAYKFWSYRDPFNNTSVS